MRRKLLLNTLILTAAAELVAGIVSMIAIGKFPLWLGMAALPLGAALGTLLYLLYEKEATRSDFDSRALQTLLQHTPDLVIIKHRGGGFLEASDSFLASVNLENSQQLRGKTWFDLLTRPQAERHIKNEIRVSFTHAPVFDDVQSQPQENGSVSWTSTTYLPVWGRDHNQVGVIHISRDIDYLKLVEGHYHYLANHDALTGLFNRSATFNALRTMLVAGNLVGIVFVDLNNFKSINDTYGHQAGDEILKAFSQNLVALTREHDVIGRIGGDEFLIVLNRLKSRADIPGILDKLFLRVNQELKVGDMKESLTLVCSAGISLFPQDGQEVEDLVSKADQAMYTAKLLTGKQLVFYSDLSVSERSGKDAVGMFSK